MTSAHRSSPFAGPRYFKPATPGLDALGPLKHLPGIWSNTPTANSGDFTGRGWNLIALPFEGENGTPFDFRVLVNQYNETLKFMNLDGSVPNRGIDRAAAQDTDQTIMAIDYEQGIAQIAADDAPKSADNGPDLAGDPGLPIHHEPGFFLFITNEVQSHQDGDLTVARLGTIPHGNSVMSMGHAREFDGPPRIPAISGLPIGIPGVPGIFGLPPGQPPELPEQGYLGPYAAFSGENAFLRNGPFPGFDVALPNFLLEFGMPDNVVHTTELVFDTKYATGNIVNVPFVKRQADASEMRSIFWIMTLDSEHANGGPQRVLAYSQLVFLDFFQRLDGVPGLIRWPHVSINMMAYEGPLPEPAPAARSMPMG
ncbi:heme-binding protein [Tropicimonas sp. S265A]|uniref:heme-binding protein n=1 Tax=Tropicimonas sp. S265A TaxID=3415134 RepID=UPI003C7A6E53